MNHDNNLPGDFDPYSEVRVNYGIEQGGSSGNQIIKWVASTAGGCLVLVIGYLFLDNGSIRRESAEDRKILTEQLSLIRERLIAIETKQQTGCKPP